MKFSTQLLKVLLFLPFLTSGTRSAPASNTERKTSYTIIVTGGEILAGVYADAHTHFLTRTLSPLGLQCAAALAVDDNPDDIQKALKFAVDTSPIVIVTGGLGPTPNDITRETLSEFTQIPLREDPDALAALEKRFSLPSDQLRANLRRQTRVPIRGRPLTNSSGTAVGLVLTHPKPASSHFPDHQGSSSPWFGTNYCPFSAKNSGSVPPAAP
jgi:nicotinamide-nucleotide amidase